MEIKDRIEEFMNFKQLTPSALEKEIGLSNGLWAKTKKVSEDVLIKFVEHFPEVSAEWLIRGKGAMLIKEVEQVIELPNNKDSELYKLCTKLADNYLERNLLIGELMAIAKKG